MKSLPKIIIIGLIGVFLLPLLSYAQVKLHPAKTQAIIITQLANYNKYPPAVQQLILAAQKLTEENLTYLYGSANPKNGGMDCSGTIYYLLQSTNLATTPRTADQIYQWVKEKGHFHAAKDGQVNYLDFSDLQPGDLLFWSGTYHLKNTSPNSSPPITHVMLYLGENMQGEPLMFGSSDGRTYQRQVMWGVSVFDFLLPNTNSAAKFVGYSCIPDLTC